jgi:3-hydroxyisobutyrate dehydrogenase-like beta-hydroxyacid dehydrogenase
LQRFFIHCFKPLTQVKPAQPAIIKIAYFEFTMTIAFLGIGLMGFPMARRLCQAGHTVHAFNRSRIKAERLAPFGARIFDTAAQAVRSADAVICMLENGAVTDDVLFAQGAAQAMVESKTDNARGRSDKVHSTLVIDMASTKPREARDHAARLAALGISHIDCPVSGGTVGAEAGTLVMMAGGKAEDFARAQDVLTVFGRSTYVGPHGAGQLAKLANQMIVGVTIGAVAEALLLCQRGGADMAKVRQAITGGFADSRILQLHGERMVNRDFAPRGRLAIQLKDMRNALDTANETSMDVPITTLFEQLYAQAAEHGLGDLDHSGLFVELASRNGMN